MQIIILGWEETEPAEIARGVRSRVEEIEREDVRLARVGTPHFERVIRRAMYILRALLNKTIWERLHHPNHLPAVRRTILVIVVPKHRRPRDIARDDGLREPRQDRPRVPRGTLPVQLVAGEDYKVGTLGV